ncbi:ParB/RepB/Spo0J family partition protein [Desulfothermus sp.]
MASPRGLGKGLDALFQDKIQVNTKSSEEGSNNFITVDIDALEPSPFQPRKFFSEESIEELAQSIKGQGLLQPILVRKKPDEGKYEIIAGERRYLACKKAGIRAVPAIECNLTDDECMVVSLVENLQREDLNVVEEARALEKIRSVLGLTQDELANRVGKSRPHIANTLRLLQLEENILQSIENGELTAGHGRALLGIGSKEDRIKVYEYTLKKGASVRDLEKIANYWRKNRCLPRYCLTEKSSRQLTEDNDLLKKIANSIKGSLGIKTTMRGTLSAGTITIKYSSRQELIDFLKKLNLASTLEENVSHETINDNQLNS